VPDTRRRVGPAHATGDLRKCAGHPNRKQEPAMMFAFVAAMFSVAFVSTLNHLAAR
jgi:hypothetical protein